MLMSAQALLDAYLVRWNARDAAGIVALFHPDGGFVEPGVRSPLTGAALIKHLEGLFDALPELRLEVTATTGDDARRVLAWTMRGTVRGTLFPGVAPTGAVIALDGVDMLEIEGGAIRAVRRRFDRQDLAEQSGAMVLVQPHVQGPAQFGYSTRIASGNPNPPGLIALTWIQGRSVAERERIRAHARQNVQDFLAEPGFLSIVTGFTGLRGFTVTAWEDESSMRRALSGHHAEAMRELFRDDVVASVWTSVWRPERINRLWVRCPSCAALEDVSDDHRACSACGAPLPERPAFW